MSGSGARLPRVELVELGKRIEDRSRAILKEHSFWPCRRGCDLCCRTLSALPLLGEPEWQRLRAALDELPDDLRAEVHRRILAAPAEGSVVCPMLDETRGECRVYEARPMVCRMHGFYTDRDGGLHCAEVGEAVAFHQAEDTVVWGNGEKIQDELQALGAARDLRDWLRELER